MKFRPVLRTDRSSFPKRELSTGSEVAGVELSLPVLFIPNKAIPTAKQITPIKATEEANMRIFRDICLSFRRACDSELSKSSESLLPRKNCNSYGSEPMLVHLKVRATKVVRYTQKRRFAQLANKIQTAMLLIVSSTYKPQAFDLEFVSILVDK